MLTSKGIEVLSELYDLFREDWLKQFPNHSENEVERHFLYSVYSGITDSHASPPENIRRKIEKIV